MSISFGQKPCFIHILSLFFGSNLNKHSWEKQNNERKEGRKEEEKKKIKPSLFKQLFLEDKNSVHFLLT